MPNPDVNPIIQLLGAAILGQTKSTAFRVLTTFAAATCIRLGISKERFIENFEHEYNGIAADRHHVRNVNPKGAKRS